ncbi:putative ABC transporter ATP-binding protein YbhF [Planctomycetes bacterium Pla163]|uniref:Putative ABC transporter ATP-binding protein YbhF n=1 Tax=Rohdeia mirabilis TaxID=2528008 RepID=A0A518CWV5_9BACT|nr:putative ABC transporter ATP-binding protein YbhF [Planctomycetes bacterium Pla163]
MIEIRSLVKRFGPFTAVDGVDLDVARGEVLGFLGPNGAGKTTTMRMVTGFLAPTSGRACVCGLDVGEDRIAAQRLLGYLPEGAPAWPDMTPAELLDFAAQARGMDRAARRAAVGRAVERVQLESVLHKPIENLSKGFKRRVGLAQAILHDPDVLVLDEPTDGLDPNQKFEVRRLIAEMSEGKAIVLSTHILEEVDAVCTRATVMAKGRLVADGTPADLRAKDPRHGAVRVRLVDAGRAGAARATLAELASVSAIEDEDGALICLAAGGASPADAIYATCREHGFDLSELTPLEGRLDEVFRELTGAPARGERSTVGRTTEEAVR